jgi:hypothetical protein
MIHAGFLELEIDGTDDGPRVNTACRLLPPHTNVNKACTKQQVHLHSAQFTKPVLARERLSMQCFWVRSKERKVLKLMR